VDRLSVCLIASEVAPLAKTGGLGDVTAALARHLHASGHDVRLFMPLYGTLDPRSLGAHPVDFLQDMELRMGRHRVQYRVLTAPLPGSDLGLYLVEAPPLFRRDRIYDSRGDEHLRFACLTRAALECCQRMGWAPHILHVNDWHTALGPLYLKTLYRWDHLFDRTRSVLTIHNIGYQGVFPSAVLPDLGLEGESGRLRREELAAGRVGFLSTGILHADCVTTVSPTHAREIQTPEYGMGLEGLVQQRAKRLVGILNGVDYNEWDPRHDPMISFHYDAENLDGKWKNKRVLLEGLGLSSSPEAPVLGIVSRLVRQKGIDLMLDPLPRFLERRDLRLVALGSGEARYENYFQWLQLRFPDKVVYYRGFQNELAHLIEAGADIFLMPSLYEPCGLNQMYSQRYGTVPLVRRTGGLADTVEPWNGGTGEGTGFVFEHATTEGFAWALQAALEVWPDRRGWRRLMANGMARNWSWERQGNLYVDLYRRLAEGSL
jgi:starch synthase